MKDKILKLFYRMLGAFARRYVKRRKPIIIGINGSVGKTSCRMIVTDIVKKYLPGDIIYTSPKNFNGELGMSLAIFKIEHRGASVGAMLSTLCKTFWLTYISNRKPYDVTILEYGIDTPGEMSFLVSIVKPHISILTKIDAVHSLQFGDPQAIAKEETKLQKATLETCIINHDDTYGRQLQHKTDVDLLRYDTHESENTDIIIRYNNYELLTTNDEGNKEDQSKIQNLKSKIYSQSNITIGNKKLVVSTNILGKNNHGYIAVGLAIADIVSHKLHGRDIIPVSGKLFLDLHLQPGRMTVFEGIHNSVILDSSYNASPLSMEAAINDVYRIQRTTLPDYKVILALGDMRELGEWEEKHHRELAAYLSQYGDSIFLLGASTGKYTVDELRKIGHDMTNIHHFMHYDTLGQAIKKLLEKNPHDNFLVLFKGSQNTIFLEEAVKHILKNKEDEKKLTRQGARRASKKHIST